ncbi:hypothetical protein BRD10_04485, partial [Halobacteriales archaeon SW_12_71_31]
MYDYHVHSTYSDGSFLEWMVRAAADAGLDGVGIADHLIVSGVEKQLRRRRREGHALDVTYERRREAVRELRERADVAVFDAAEVDYHPADEARIERFREATLGTPWRVTELRRSSARTPHYQVTLE